MNQKPSVVQIPKSVPQVLTSDTQGTLEQPYGYTGREYDAESGLYHYRARSYDPATGMFVQSDPIGFASGQENLYAYVDSNPFGFNDPSGHMASIETREAMYKDAATAIATTTTIGMGVIAALTPISTAFADALKPLGTIDGLDNRANPGDCSLLMQRELQDEVNAENPEACQPVLTKYSAELRAEKRRWNLTQMRGWSRQAFARGAVAHMCYRGGDSGHREAMREATLHVYKCNNYIQNTYGPPD